MDGEDVDVDDLFNEEDLEQAAMNIPLPGNDVVTSSAQPISLDAKIRLDELHQNGCRQRIAWSRLGCVAAISEDSTSVSIQCLRLNRRTAVWELSSKYPLELGTDDACPHVYIHLCWSGTGTDLAIFDTKGRITIVGMFTASAVNRFQDLGYINPDQGDDLRPAVGAFWLPSSDRPVPAVTQFSKQDDQWITSVSSRKPLGPSWPRALLLVTRLGDLRLIYMKLDRTWSDTLAKLSSPSSAQDLLTHAAFACTFDGSVLLSTHSANGTLSVYLVQVNRPTLSQETPISTPITLTVEHIKDNIHNGRTSSSGDLMNDTPNTSGEISCLSHLEIVPTTDIEKAVQIPPTIFAVNTTFGTIPGVSNSLQSKSSIVQRWSLYTVSQTLHPRFYEIPAKGSSDINKESSSIKTLQRLPDIPFDGIITSIHLVENASTLAITTLDGTTSFYNANTMTPVFYESSAQEVTSLSQAGFTFPPTQSPFDICFSTNACCAASLSMDQSAKEKAPLTLTTTTHHSALQEPTSDTLSPLFASLLLTFLRACYIGTNTDDILTCILRTVHPTHIPHLNLLVLTTLFRPGDFILHGQPGSEVDKLAHKQLIPKCLSLFAALSVQSSSDGKLKRSLPGRYAWLTLQIRHVAMQLIYVVNSEKQRERLPAEIVRLTGECVGWGFGLFRFIVDELCAIDDGEDGDGAERMLCSWLLGGVWSRYFLKTIDKVFRSFAGSQVETVESIARVVKEQQSKGLSVNGVGLLLEASEQFAGAADPNRERKLLALGDGEAVLLARLVKDVLPGMRKNGDVDKLAIYTSGMDRQLNWTLLEDGDVDVHRKTRVKAKGKTEVRRCVRCCGISEDVGGPKREWPKWIQQQIMRCVCEAGSFIEAVDE
jgi:mediator of RNA polymerase II transcription subunit 16, fungi type